MTRVRIELSEAVLRLEVNGTSYGPGPVVLVSDDAPSEGSPEQ